MPAQPYIRWFKELSLDDLPLVGGKNASLGEMFQQLRPLGVRVPDGFAVTAQAYRDALDAAGAWPELHALLDGLDKTDVPTRWRGPARGRARSSTARPMPAAVEQQLRQAWRELKAQVAMR
jgi:pyruvate,water dikinase